jgi:hypothetical protein
MSSSQSSRPNKAEQYVIRDVWVDDGVSGKELVIDVQGVRGDGSYWVTGFQLRVPLSDVDKISRGDIIVAVRDKALENERKLDRDYMSVADNVSLTENVKKMDKVASLVGMRITVSNVGIL